MAIGPIVTRGFGTFGSIVDIVTRGFRAAVSIFTPTPASRVIVPVAEFRTIVPEAEMRIITAEPDAMSNNAPKAWPNKDPDEKLDYGIDWSTRLDDGDTIATSTWDIPSGVTASAISNTTTDTKVWIEGGVLGKTYPCTNHIVTAGGRHMDQTGLIYIAEK